MASSCERFDNEKTISLLIVFATLHFVRFAFPSLIQHLFNVYSTIFLEHFLGRLLLRSDRAHLDRADHSRSVNVQNATFHRVCSAPFFISPLNHFFEIVLNHFQTLLFRKLLCFLDDLPFTRRQLLLHSFRPDESTKEPLQKESLAE